MEIDIKEHWGIDLKEEKEFKSPNPLNNNIYYMVNGKYFLKTDDICRLKLRERELQILKQLSAKDVPVLIPKKGKIVTFGSKIYWLYDLLDKGDIDYKKDFLKAENITYELAKLSKININLEEEVLTDSLCKIEQTLIKRKSKNNIISKCLGYLNKNFFPFLSYYNFCLSHGDFHQDNILLKENSVNAIIDWELVKKREELYDLAMLIGCVGIIDPTELLGDWVKTLIKSYSLKSKSNKLAFTLLPEMVLSLRLKWMYKWYICGEDEAVIDMESSLLELIFENIERIRKLWLSYLDTDFKHSKSKWVMQDAFLIEEINKAKENVKSIDNISFDNFKDKEKLSMNLRMLGIDKGMKDDLLGVLKIRNLIMKLSNDYPDNKHIMIEMFITMGNSCLDFSKFRLVDAIENTIKIAQKIRNAKDIPELDIGYSFMLRNASIAFAETGELDKMKRIVDTLIELNDKSGDINVKEELARALSNAITSLLPENVEKARKYFRMLEDIYLGGKDSKKINGAYQIAKVNLNKLLN